jgi:hypothetical protein
MAASQATAASVKISKNARSSGVKTQKFFCECGSEIKMLQRFTRGKLMMVGHCEGCGQEGRSPKSMRLKKEKILIEKVIE